MGNALPWTMRGRKYLRPQVAALYRFQHPYFVPWTSSQNIVQNNRHIAQTISTVLPNEFNGKYLWLSSAVYDVATSKPPLDFNYNATCLKVDVSTHIHASTPKLQLALTLHNMTGTDLERDITNNNDKLCEYVAMNMMLPPELNGYFVYISFGTAEDAHAEKPPLDLNENVAMHQIAVENWRKHADIGPIL
eukprot:158579_1